MNDLHNNTKFSRSISPVAIITGNGTTVGQTIDTQGFGATEHVVAAGVITDGTFTFTMFEGNASNMSDEGAVAAADLIGSNPVFVATTDNNLVKKVGYKGAKRYTRMKAVQTGATTGGFISATAVQGTARNAPVA